jgi:homoserine kinase type II
VALLTPLAFDDARQLSQAFGLTLEEITPLAQGSVNSNFRLRTAQGQYFARLYEEQTPAGAALEMRTARELVAHGVPTPAPLQPVSLPEPLVCSGKAFAVYPWVQGEILCQRRTTVQHLDQLGRALARLHQASDKLSHIPEGRFEPRDLEVRLTAIERQIGEGTSVANASDLRVAVELIRERLNHYATLRDDTLPRGIIHGDLFRDNALWVNDELTAVIDFESASRGTFAYDVMVCVHAWCYSDHFELDKVKALLTGYTAERPLGVVEVVALVGEGAIAALRFATTRITDFALRAAPGETPKRDYRRFLARLNELEHGELGRMLQGNGRMAS